MAVLPACALPAVAGAVSAEAAAGAVPSAARVMWGSPGASAFFVGPASMGTFDVHIAAADGIDETPVATDGPDEYWPAWAPDGSRLAFDRVVVLANNLVQVVVFDPATSTEVGIDSDPLSGIPLVWSPDSTEIVAQLPADAEAASD